MILFWILIGAVALFGLGHSVGKPTAAERERKATKRGFDEWLRK